MVGWWSSACKKSLVKMVEQCMSNQDVVRFWALGLDKIICQVSWVLKIIVRVGSAKKASGWVLTQPIPTRDSI